MNFVGCNPIISLGNRGRQWLGWGRASRRDRFRRGDC